ncbi:MAG: ABC transporter ATP-binding protein [Nevskia sp.]|nr:ABC transporter ATP-binding protein [Nevskia sp.]
MTGQPPTPKPAVLESRELVKLYPKVRAVDGISFAVTEGTCFGLLGPNGAGKSTTIEMMEGLLPPTSGQVLFRGAPLGQRYRERVGIQFQTTALQEFLTTRENLRFFGSLYPRQRPLEELVALCRLEEFLDRDAGKLSGGQRQRLLLAIALVNDPEVLFLDEPTTGLDPQARRNFWDLVQGVKARGKTIVLTTHYMDEAYLLCDEIAIVDHGRIIAQGSPAALLREHFDDSVLELPAPEARKLEGGLQYKEKGDHAEIHTADINGTIARLLAVGASLAHLRIRPRTLEDLFLELTGRELRA